MQPANMRQGQFAAANADLATALDRCETCGQIDQVQVSYLGQYSQPFDVDCLIGRCERCIRLGNTTLVKVRLAADTV